MKLTTPKNSNYSAIVVEVKTIVPLENCNNVQHALIMGNAVVVDKSVKVGDIGIYFPLETQLSKEYLSKNNLYRKKELNADTEKAGYFEENGRIRCVKFRNNKSEGLFMPLSSINFFLNKGDMLKLGDEFDELNNVEICKKYIPKYSKTPGAPGSGKKGKGKIARESKLIEGQFRFHDDTSMLYRNLHKLHSDDIISITYKIHGTSTISSFILCKKPLNWVEKALKRLKVNIVDTHYDNVYASRKVIKNEDLNPNAQHYYNEDIWGIANNELKDFLLEGMTIYGEVAGYLPLGGMIQKDYDYGCEPSEHKLYIYRITYTNPKGKVFEFSAKQVQDWCRERNLNAVPQLYYGYIKDFIINHTEEWKELNFNIDSGWQDKFLDIVKKLYNEKDCKICKNKVPEEGCVVRIEKNEFEAYKQKSERFYLRETKLLDEGTADIETEN